MKYSWTGTPTLSWLERSDMMYRDRFTYRIYGTFYLKPEEGRSNGWVVRNFFKNALCSDSIDELKDSMEKLKNDYETRFKFSDESDCFATFEIIGTADGFDEDDCIDNFNRGLPNFIGWDFDEVIADECIDCQTEWYD